MRNDDSMLKQLMEKNKQLREKVDFFESIFQNLNAAVNINDIEKQGPVWVTKGFNEYIGYEMEDLQDIEFHASLLHPEDKHILYEGVDELNKKSVQEYSNAYRIRHKNGNYVWLYTTGVAFKRDKKGKVKQILGLTINMGERLKYEEQLEALLEENNQLKHKLKLEKLTKREKDILASIAKGLTMKEIAHIKELTPNTVNSYRKEISKKLGMRNIAELAAFAKKCGL